jgi:hypothetical protein
VGRLAVGIAAALTLGGATGGGDSLPTVLPASGYSPRERDDTLKLPAGLEEELRRDALARAVLWHDPQARAVPVVPRSGLDPFGGADEVACRFRPTKVSGTTPKFMCVFEGGEVLKVKYGRNPEIHTEAAATRLLRALGAGGDEVFVLKRLRCFGCPDDPQRMLSCISSTFESWVRQCETIYGKRTPTGGLEVEIDYGRYVDFAPAAVERKLDAMAIETDRAEGWGFDELDEVQGDRGRAERDALRLVAVLLNDWDTRADNQRLVCLDEEPPKGGRCRRPLAYLQDVGATFGRAGGAKEERKLDLVAWRSVAVWKDEGACVVEIDAPPLHGATFAEAAISERGRLSLAARLRRLTPARVRRIFEEARFAERAGARGPGDDVDEWVRTFEDKARQITTRQPCPTP